MKTILITAGGLSPVGINTVLSLKDYYKIVCVDIKPRHNTVAPYFCKQYYEVPMASDKISYIKKILDICKREGVETILPLTVEEILVLLSKKSTFKKNGICIANGNTVENIKKFSDKWLTNDALRGEGISIPNAIPIFSAQDIRDNIKKFGYPKNRVVIKPRASHGSRGFKIITADKNDLSLITDLKPTDFHFVTLDYLCDAVKNKKLNAVLMDYLEGDDYSVYSFCMGKESPLVLPMKRTGLIPGMSTGGILQKEENIVRYVTKIIQTFGFRGAINFQLKNTDLGPLVYEINTRISATTVISRGTGLNFPLYEILLAERKFAEIRKDITKIKIAWGLKLYRIQREIYQQGKKLYEI